MRRIVVVHDHARVRRDGERVEIVSPAGRISVPVRYVEMVVSLGSLELSSPALSLLMDREVPVFFLTRFGRLKGVLWSKVLSSNCSGRIRQYERFLKDSFGVAKGIVRAKVKAIEDEFGLDLSHVKCTLERAKTKEDLLGLEGYASRLMFKSFGDSISGSPINFKERKYYPPPDPTNALLSLSYTLLHAISLPLVAVVGLDPYISFLHSKRGTHTALCSDVVEPVRPFITKAIEEPIRQGVFTPKDFRREKKACYLKRESFPKFMRWFESRKDEVVAKLKESVGLLLEACHEEVRGVLRHPAELQKNQGYEGSQEQGLSCPA